MRPLSTYRPGTWLVSLLAALTTWVTLLAWAPFAQRPAGYLVPLVAACLLVAVVGMLLRSARMPSLLVALGQVVVVLLWFQHRVAADQALLGLVPTPSSVQAVVDALQAAGTAAQTYAAPVPASVPEFNPLLILTGAIAAVVVDLLAVGLRRVPLAGLPLLAAYTAPVTILDGGVPALIFAAAALCFLFLLAASEDARLARWGRALTPPGNVFDDHSGVVGGRAVWSSARKIGGSATLVAVLVPLLVPTFSTTFFSGGSGNGPGNGSAVSISNPMVDLKRDLIQGADVELLRITTTDPDPSYLRISVLNSFDGDAWRPAGRNIPVSQRADGAVSAAPGLDKRVARTTFRASIAVDDSFNSRWLPTPYPVTSIDAAGDWRYDKSTLDFLSAADNQSTAGLHYRLTSETVRPTERQLSDPSPTPLTVFTPNTALPRTFPASVAKLARTVTQGDTTELEQAAALQQWFREGGGFRYSLKRPRGNSTGDLVSFLSTGKNGRVGYCEQFAAAMAVMGRSLGIPSRVAVGFLHPDAVATDTWSYSSHDLHAWPEMYFGGVGWVRFEPTPQDRTGSAPGYSVPQLPSSTPSSSGAASSSSASLPVPSATRADRGNDQVVATPSSSTGSGPGPRTLVLGAVGLLVLVLVGLAPRTLRALVRRRRWAEAGDPRGWVEAAWSEIRDTALDLGIAWQDHVTLRATAANLDRSFGDSGDTGDTGDTGEASKAIRRLVGLLERARYARDLPVGSTTRDQVRDDVSCCVQALETRAGHRRTRRARWLPVSVLSSVRTRRRDAVRRSRSVGEPGVDRAV